ncbi:MAG TPA: cyclase family protein [Acetobacteraceae bacterium]|nr:cyclase family protein [Acetobacteraceae bacterium]
MEVPRYDDLPRPENDPTGLPLAWGVWGPDDEIGALNRITPERVAAAAAEIREGRRFNLNLPLDEPFGRTHAGSHRRRAAPMPTLVAEEHPGRVTRDDKLDGFWLQASTQWDGLSHFADPTHGFYNGAPISAIVHGEASRNGIDKALAHGIAGRCVLADLARHFARTGRDWGPLGGRRATAAEVAACLEAQGVALRPGDVLLVRTGWLEAFRAAPDVDARDLLVRGTDSVRDYSGVSGGEDMWRLLWDEEVAAICADNPTVEVWPIHPWKPSLHLSIARMGMMLGEFFDLEALAADSAASGRYTAFFTAAPLNLRGGIGSPGNALAIR